MEQIYKLAISIIVITLVLNYVAPLINNYRHYLMINEFANDLRTLIQKMNDLKELSDPGSFEQARVVIPIGYELTFNNETSTIDVNGAEELSINLSVNLNNELIISEGDHIIRLYYGNLSQDEFLLKDNLVTFK